MNCERKKRETEYNCAECACRHTIICNECSRIFSPRGKKHKPTYYVKLDEPLNGADRSSGITLEDVMLRLSRSTDEELANLIIHCLERRSAVPIAVVMAYNQKRKAERFVEQEA